MSARPNPGTTPFLGYHHFLHPRDWTVRQSADLDALRSRVHITLVHEIGHYFGLDDARLHELGWA